MRFLRETATFGLTLSGALLLWLSGAAALAVHALTLSGPGAATAGLGLAGYRVEIEARPVAGITDNLSGLTFSNRTGTLFATINRPAQIVELSPEGRLLRRIALTGASDVEAITHVEGDSFLISDEASSRVSRVRIGAWTASLDLATAPHWQLPAARFRNLGIEGLSWDPKAGRAIVAREMWPLRITVIDGLAGQGAGAPQMPAALPAVTTQVWEPRLGLGHSFADVSSVSVLDGSGGVLLLSHLSAALAEFSADGTPLGLMLLWPGRHGLKARVPQAEGVTTGPDGSIYIVSEPNLFYRFALPERNNGSPATMPGEGLAEMAPAA